MKTNTIARLLREVTGKYKASIVVALIFILVSTFANVAGSFFVQSLVDVYILPLLGESSPQFGGLIRALSFMAVIYITGTLCTLAYTRMMASISQGVQKKIRDNMFSHMQTLPVRYFDSHSHGDIMSRYTNDIETLREFFSMSLPQVVSSSCTIITVAIAMLVLSPTLSLLVFAFVIVMLLTTRLISGRAAKSFILQQKSMGEINGFIEEMMSGQKVIKVFCHEKTVVSEFDEIDEVLRGQATTANSLTNVLMPVIMNLGNVQYVAIAMLGGVLALNGMGGITLGTIAAFLTLSKSFSAPISQISLQINTAIMALAGAERIFEILDEPSEVDDGYVTLVNAKLQPDGTLTECPHKSRLWAWKHPHEDGTTTYTALDGDVRFFDVDFGYNKDHLVLKEVNLYANPGHKLAFVGATGAGKTTITNLINRFYDIADGKIRFDGININKIKKNDLRRSLGIVLQDTNLFSGTVADNIRYGKLDATDEEVENAAKIANAHDFISRLPEGYNTHIEGNASNLSNGQCQLLAIARAAVADPPVMILDEATSSIDTRTEAIVQRGMDALMEGRTVFVIAHRLSTVKNANVIMVMEQGRIIERGNHEALMEQKGKYFQLYTGSFAD